jgi:hypothetical protein
MRRLRTTDGNRRSSADAGLAGIGILQELLSRTRGDVISCCGTIAIRDGELAQSECVDSEGEGRAMAVGWSVHGCQGGAEEYSARVFRGPSRYLTTGSDSLAAELIRAKPHRRSLAEAAELGLINRNKILAAALPGSRRVDLQVKRAQLQFEAI